MSIGFGGSMVEVDGECDCLFGELCCVFVVLSVMEGFDLVDVIEDFCCFGVLCVVRG